MAIHPLVYGMLLSACILLVVVVILAAEWIWLRLKKDLPEAAGYDPNPLEG